MSSLAFTNLPWLIQNRFIEICDTQTLANFSRINSWTRKLSKKRIKSVETLEGIPKNDLKNGPNLLEIKKYMSVLGLPQLLLEDVANIIPSYSKLDIHTQSIKIRALKHLILGANLKDFSLLTKLDYEKIEEVKEVVDILLTKNFERVSISILNYDPKENQELRVVFKSLIEKYNNKGHTFHVYISDLVYPDKKINNGKKYSLF